MIRFRKSKTIAVTCNWRRLARALYSTCLKSTSRSTPLSAASYCVFWLRAINTRKQSAQICFPLEIACCDRTSVVSVKALRPSPATYRMQMMIKHLNAAKVPSSCSVSESSERNEPAKPRPLGVFAIVANSVCHGARQTFSRTKRCIRQLVRGTPAGAVNSKRVLVRYQPGKNQAVSINADPAKQCKVSENQKESRDTRPARRLSLFWLSPGGLSVTTVCKTHTG